MDDATEKLRAALRQVSDSLQKLAPKQVGAWIREEFILRVGIDCKAQPLPPDYTRMTPRACFNNAFLLATATNGLRYCEGFAACPALPFPVHHAWCIDRRRRVIDPTLSNPEECGFIGYPVSTREMTKLVFRRGGMVAVLSDQHEMARVDWIVRKCPELARMMPDMAA